MEELFRFTKEQEDDLNEINASFEKVLSPYAVKNSDAIRLFPSKHCSSILRSSFSIDVDRIIYHPLYNRYSDKTQVFSFCSNDDITRRALHVQLVSKIARTIGRALRLNLELIEAIALGHDMGHTPFGHKGESFLSDLYKDRTKQYFNHNVHSVRIFKELTGTNLTLQTLDGILCHNGEKVYQEYQPSNMKTTEEFEELFRGCYINGNATKALKPSTLEGCVVRISDIIAYVGRDRQDQYKLKLLEPSKFEHNGIIGSSNSNIIANVTTNIIKNSIGKNYIGMDKEVYTDLYELKEENNMIYRDPRIDKPYDDIIKQMFKKMYSVFVRDIENDNYKSIIYQHHLFLSFYRNSYKKLSDGNIKTIVDDVIVDFIASMTDDYFLDAFKLLFPKDKLNEEVLCKGYF